MNDYSTRGGWRRSVTLGVGVGALIGALVFAGLILFGSDEAGAPAGVVQDASSAALGETTERSTTKPKKDTAKQRRKATEKQRKTDTAKQRKKVESRNGKQPSEGGDEARGDESDPTANPEAAAECPEPFKGAVSDEECLELLAELDQAASNSKPGGKPECPEPLSKAQCRELGVQKGESKTEPEEPRCPEFLTKAQCEYLARG